MLRLLLFLCLLFPELHSEGVRQRAARPSYYERCVELGPEGAGEGASFVLEWSALSLQRRVQFAFHARSGRGFTGMGFNDVGSGFQIVAGHPAEDLPCVQALYTPALSRDSEGDPAPFGVEVPGQYVLSDGMWSHVLVDRNLSVSGDADPYHFNVTFTMLWGYRNAAVQEGVCQDLGVADQTTEYAHFALDLSDPDNAYANPARRQKHFSQGERRCTRLSAASIYGTPIHGEGVLSGERHQGIIASFVFSLEKECIWTRPETPLVRFILLGIFGYFWVFLMMSPTKSASK